MKINNKPDNNRKQIQEFLKDLQDGSSHERVTAASWFGLARAEEGLNPLLDCLESDDDSLVRFMAAQSLGLIGDKKAVIPLVHAWRKRSENNNVRGAAIWSLGQLGLLEKSNESGIPSVEHEEITQSDLLAVDKYNSSILLLLKGGLTIGDQKWVSKLMTALVNPVYLCDFVQKQSIRSLLKYGTELMLDALVFLIGQEGLQFQAINALRNFPKAESIKVIQKFSGDKDSKVREIVKKSIKELEVD